MGGLYPPREVDDGFRAPEEAGEIAAFDVCFGPVGFRNFRLGPTAREAEDVVDACVIRQASEEARPHVPGRSDDDDAHEG
jgi:hypothetical protein